MIFGEPLDFSRYRDQAEDHMVQRKITDEIMLELMRLSGQQYVDEYAAVVKLRLAGATEGRESADPLAQKDDGGAAAAG